MVSASSLSELTRPIRAKALPGEAVEIEADARERAALAERFGLAGIDRLHARVDLTHSGAAIRATGTLDAAIRQTCAVSGEDFPARIDTDIDLRFVEEGARDLALDDDEPIEVELEADDCDEIEYGGETFDLGEAIAQTLGLSIDPYAEGPGADEARRRAGITGEGEQDGPLAEALQALKKK